MGLNSTPEIGAIIRRRGYGLREFPACHLWTKRKGSKEEPITVSTRATGAKWRKKCSSNTRNSKTGQEIYKCQQACSLPLKASNQTKKKQKKPIENKTTKNNNRISDDTHITKEDVMGSVRSKHKLICTFECQFFFRSNLCVLSSFFFVLIHAVISE